MKSFWFCSLVLALGVSQLQAQSDKKETATAAPVATEKKAEPAAQKEVAIIKTTAGEMVVEFWPEVAPETVKNFKKLAREGFYDGTAFHRIIDGFMIQGGDPLTKDASKEAAWGTGDPGYKIKGEFNPRPHVRGVLSMARSNDPNSAGSQFFICLGDASSLNNKYTGFGQVIKGDDVLGKIGKTPVAPSSRGEMSKPKERVGVQSVTIVNRDTLK